MRLVSSAKTERLVNLTMALLGTKRYMTKSEIFRRVAGYSGSSETKERMFERDKDDLRGLGIEIEVASHDPLFDDEVGYRIRPEIFQLRESFTSEELGLVALALDLIKGTDFEETGESLFRRINSLAISPEMLDEIELASTRLGEQGLHQILSAMSERKKILFDYRKEGSSQSEQRQVNPLGLSAWRGSWYLIGEDLIKDDVRVFKLSRITSEIETNGPANAYSIPEDFTPEDYLVMLKPADYGVIFKLRSTCGVNLRNNAVEIERIDEDWDRVKINFQDLDHALREVLWLGPDVVVEQPEDLRSKVISCLENLMAKHG